MKSVHFPLCCHMMAQIPCHTPANVQLERQEVQVASPELSASFSDCFMRFFQMSVSQTVLTMNTLLTLSFAVLSGDKAAAATNGRTQENTPERAGKG